MLDYLRQLYQRILAWLDLARRKPFDW